MRIITLGFAVILFAGCDTIGGRTVVLNFPPPSKQPHADFSVSVSEVEEAVRLVDATLASEGVIRSTNSPALDDQHFVSYCGGPFTMCQASFRDGKLFVSFRNGNIGSSRPSPPVERISNVLAEKLRNKNFDPKYRESFFKALVEEVKPICSYKCYEKIEKIV